MKVTNAKQASYGIVDHRYAMVQLAQTMVRSVIGTLDLDHTFEDRELINSQVISALNEVGRTWGVIVSRYEVKNIVPPASVRDSMERQMAAERERRALLARAEALKALVESETGTNLLAAYKRAQNILRIEEKKDGPHTGPVDAALLTAPEEQALAAALDAAEPATQAALVAEDYNSAMSALAALRGPVDAFFDRVTVNDPDAQLRRNRLRLLARLRTGMDAVADFSRIEG
jgi:regulator of protease activity HflC (stomatin/prohibitin superfamily)